MVPCPAPPTAEMLLLKLLLPLLWGIECAGSWGSQAGAGAPTNPRSSLSSWHLYDRHQLQVPKPMMVQEGLCVFIPCTFSYPQDGWIDSDPVLVYWFRQGPNNINPEQDVPVATNNPQRKVKEETKGRFQLLGDPQANNCSLYITGAQKSDSGKYIFRLERGKEKYSYKDALLTVKVTELKYLEYLGNGSSLPILEGESLRLLCVADGNPLATQSWVRGRRPVSPSEPWDPSVLELHRIQKEDEGEVTCRAQNRLGSQHVSLRLSVLCALKLVRQQGNVNVGENLFRRPSWELASPPCSFSVPASSSSWSPAGVLARRPPRLPTPRCGHSHLRRRAGTPLRLLRLPWAEVPGASGPGGHQHHRVLGDQDPPVRTGSGPRSGWRAQGYPEKGYLRGIPKSTALHKNRINYCMGVAQRLCARLLTEGLVVQTHQLLCGRKLWQSAFVKTGNQLVTYI
ncbi:sialic acid-binding Ig-like lectin 8 isoform X5 [Loxodonta africana]|uniref:sialic acid-binding Ig-like lectin 8 isoform X5 n=1 Tax=Loxodonta africana TaxID=9785 RepID=UPI000C813274|nr:sialic acid-binding Ig-like lectin 8 isoform X5 [Loxodonta africana]